MIIFVNVISALMFAWLWKNSRSIGVSINHNISRGGDGGAGGSATAGDQGTAVGGGGGGGGGSAPSFTIGVPDEKKIKWIECVTGLGTIIQLVTALLQLK